MKTVIARSSSLCLGKWDYAVHVVNDDVWFPAWSDFSKLSHPGLLKSSGDAGGVCVPTTSKSFGYSVGTPTHSGCSCWPSAFNTLSTSCQLLCHVFSLTQHPLRKISLLCRVFVLPFITNTAILSVVKVPTITLWKNVNLKQFLLVIAEGTVPR